MLTDICPSNILTAFRVGILEPVTIRPAGLFYLVDFGEDVAPRYHYVLLEGPNGTDCNCTLGSTCPALQYVQEHLADVAYRQSVGDDMAHLKATSLPHPTFEAMRPSRCPICGSQTRYCQRLSSPHRGEGWQCTQGGAGHYWLNRVSLTTTGGKYVTTPL